MGRMKQLVWVPVVAALLVSACGSDDDSPAAPSGDDSVSEADEGGSGGSDQEPDEDLVAGIMSSFLGPDSVEILTDQERDCMNDVLAPSFPTGLPPDLAATDEFQGVLDALNTAAESCNVTL